MAVAPRCVSIKRELALPQAPVLGDPLPVLIPLLCRGQEVTLQEVTHNRHIVVCPSLMPPRSPGRTALSPVSLVRLFLVPNEFPEGCGHTMEQLGLLTVELRQRGHCLSTARTRVPWGDVGGGGRAEFVHGQQQLEPLPPADSVSAPRSVWG